MSTRNWEMPGLWPERSIAPGVGAKLSPQQRDEIRQRFAQASEEDPELRPWTFAKRVCLEYEVTVGVINSLIN